MNTTNADFFLASTEGYGLESPRACYRLRRVGGRNGDDYLVVRIEPPLGPYGSDATPIDTVVLATRHEGTTLYPISDWPIHVHVARVVNPVAEGYSRFERHDLESIAWAELYPSYEAAKHEVERDKPLA